VTVVGQEATIVSLIYKKSIVHHNRTLGYHYSKLLLKIAVSHFSS